MERLAGTIDVPAASGPFHPVEQWVEGWAYARPDPVVCVDLYLDDHLLGRTTPNRRRPDVAEALGDAEAEFSGFGMAVSAPPVLSSRHALLRAVVTTKDGTREDLASVAVQFQPVVLGSVDVPAQDAVIDPARLRVWGWAHAWVSPVARIDLFLSDRWVGRAGLGRPRPDVARSLAQPDAELAGFELIVAKTLVPSGVPISIRAAVTLLDGTKHDLHPRAVRAAATAQRPAQVPNRAPVVSPTPGGRAARHRIRVLWPARGLDQGGSQLRMAELVEHLGRGGEFQNTVVSASEGPLRSVLEAAGATVHIRSAIPLDDAAAYERGVAAMGEWMDRRFDMVVGFTVTSFPAVDAASRLGLPSVLRIGEAEPLPTVVGWLFGRLDPEVERRAREAMAVASAVLSNSHAAVATYRADGYTGRFLVLGTGVDVAGAQAYRAATDRLECRRRLAIDPAERLLVWPASIWPIKGQAVLTRALAVLHHQHPHLSCALLGDSNAEYAHAVSALAARHGVGHLVRVLPFQRDLRPWWRAADVAVCSAETESLPAAVLEAMAYGLPVLSTRVGDLPRVVEENVTGWLCDPSDVGSMLAGLELVATASNEHLRRMGKAAARTVARSYDGTEVLDKSTELLRAIAGGTLPIWARTQESPRVWLGGR